jgi:hypothetical protein
MPLYLEVVEHKEISCLCRESKHNTLAVKFVSSYNTDYTSSENFGRRAGRTGEERINDEEQQERIFL